MANKIERNNDKCLTTNREIPTKNVVITVSQMIAKRCMNSTILTYHVTILNPGSLNFNMSQQNAKY